MLEFGNLMCCGVKELRGVSHFKTPEDVIRALNELTYSRQTIVGVNRQTGKTIYKPEPFSRFRYILFSQARQEADYGFRLAAFVRDKQLGSLVETDFHLNPNSGNMLKVWIWTVNHDATEQWLKEDKKIHGEKAREKASTKVMAVGVGPNIG